VVVTLLALSSCAAPRGGGISIADPEERSQRILDLFAGDATEPPDGLPEAERSLQRHLQVLKNPRWPLLYIVIDLGDVDPVLPKQPDYGLYANPIP
jgi:hypothetical protein